ncbi:polysaccharide biosynthesis tyrosine autokinase [Microbulbifer sp. SAOS-129_SWC]|uniref:GumC family protein n=1 Tax=Microbulbifer sp. SAOS-129_SWC TaxID=3145235 RepID=UPI003217ABEC
MNRLKTSDNDGDVFEDQALDFRKYWQMISMRIWMVLGLTVAITAVVALVVAEMPSRYQATATLMFEGDKANLVSVKDLYDLGTQRGDYMRTQAALLQSRDLATRVIKRLNLVDNPEFNPEENEAGFGLRNILNLFSGDESSNPGVERSKLEKVTSIFLKRLTITPKPNTNLVDLTFESKSPVLAATVANAMVAEYIKNRSDIKAEFTSRATSWLNERLQTLRAKLEQSEVKLHDFREANDLLDVSGVRSLAEQDLNATTAQLQDLRREKKQAYSVYKQVRDLSAHDPKLANLPEFLSNPAIQEIKRSEAVASRKVAELSRRYGPKHPKMVDAKKELALVREQLFTEIGNLSEAIVSRYETAAARVSAQEQEVERAKQKYQDVSRKEVRYDELKREAEVNQQLFNAFLTRVNEAKEVSGFNMAPAVLANAAVAPEKPVKPQKALIVAAAFTLALMFSVALAIMLDSLHVGLRSIDDVEVFLGQNLIGLIPAVKAARGEEEGLSLHTFYDPDQHTFAESVRTLRTGVVLSSLGESGKVIALTSSAAGEGKTSVAESLAFALGQVEKVLLIDGDLRKPVIAADFDIELPHAGLTNLIADTATLEECIHHDSKSGIDVIPAGDMHPDPQKLLISPDFDKTIKMLAERYDRVIIDTPPAQAISDALLISRSSDSILYVVQYDVTNKRLVNKGLSRLRQVGATICGVVLNQVDAGKKSLYADEYAGYEYGRDRAPERDPDAELADTEQEKDSAEVV